MRWLLIVLFLAGCASPGAPDTTDPVDDVGTVREMGGLGIDPWAEGLDEAVLVAIDAAFIVEGDVPCANSYAIEHEREEPYFIAPGTDHLVFEASTSGGYAGFQVGYAIDGEFTWLPTVPSNSAATYKIDIPDDAFEEDRFVWEFYHRLNVPVVEPDCYTGAGAGSWSMHVTAYPA